MACVARTPFWTCGEIWLFKCLVAQFDAACADILVAVPSIGWLAGMLNCVMCGQVTVRL